MVRKTSRKMFGYKLTSKGRKITRSLLFRGWNTSFIQLSILDELTKKPKTRVEIVRSILKKEPELRTSTIDGGISKLRRAKNIALVNMAGGKG